LYNDLRFWFISPVATKVHAKKRSCPEGQHACLAIVSSS
jgi:hypothetical protein